MSSSTVTGHELRRLADIVDTVNVTGHEIAEIALAINGATGRTDAVLTVAHVDPDAGIEWEERKLEL
jgi:hypothetical protein